MAYDPGAIDATLAAAVGDEPQLIAELREAFLDGVRRGLDNLERARGADEWRSAAARLKGLAASFRGDPPDGDRVRGGRCGAAGCEPASPPAPGSRTPLITDTFAIGGGSA